MVLKFTYDFDPLEVNLQFQDQTYLKNCNHLDFQNVYDLNMDNFAFKSNNFLFLSGGYDSELALVILKFNNIPITPVIIRFENNFNVFDVERALLLSNKYNLKPLIFDLKLDMFFQEPLVLTWINEFRLKTQFSLPLLWVMAILNQKYKDDAFYIIAQGDPWLVHHDQKIKLLINEEMFVYEKFFQKYQINGSSRFFEKTNASYFTLLYFFYYFMKYSGEKNFYRIKSNIYHYYFGFEKRSKYMGWEKFFNDPETRAIYKSMFEKYFSQHITEKDALTKKHFGIYGNLTYLDLDDVFNNTFQKRIFRSQSFF